MKKLIPFLLVAEILFSAPSFAMRLVSFNLLHDSARRAERMVRAGSVVKELEGDIVALQEVANGVFLKGDPVTEMLKVLEPREFWVNRHWQETNFGIYQNGLAVLSPYPMTRGEYVPFKASVIFDRKGFMETELLTPEGRVRFINAHLRSSDRAAIKETEFHQLAEYLANRGSRLPVVIMGDFNWDWHHPVFQEFARLAGAQSIYDTMPAGNYVTWTENYEDKCTTALSDADGGGQQIDNILLIQGTEGPRWKLSGGRIHVPTALPHPSDHCAIAVDLSSYPKSPEKMHADNR